MCVYIYLSIYLSINKSIYLSIYLYLYLYLSIYLSLSICIYIYIYSYIHIYIYIKSYILICIYLFIRYVIPGNYPARGMLLLADRRESVPQLPAARLVITKSGIMPIILYIYIYIHNISWIIS